MGGKPMLCLRQPRGRASHCLTLDDLSYSMGEVFHLERFGHHKRAALQAALTNDRVLSVPGNEQHLQIWPTYPSSIGHLLAIQSARQSYISDQQIYSGV